MWATCVIDVLTSARNRLAKSRSGDRIFSVHPMHVNTSCYLISVLILWERRKVRKDTSFPWQRTLTHTM